MDNDSNLGIADEPAGKKQGRPPGPRKTMGKVAQERSVRRTVRKEQVGEVGGTAEEAYAGAATAVMSGEQEEQLAYTLTENNLTSFSRLLSNILRRDRSEITRVAHELEVAENTIYRWMNGSSEPRMAHLKRLPEVLSDHRSTLIYAINQTFGSIVEMSFPGLREIRKDVYYRVLELVSTSEDADTRFYQVSQAVFEYALLHMDIERKGLAMMFAKLMPPRADGIHSMRETAIRGTHPWPLAVKGRAYLGSSTLAGSTAVLQRIQLWEDTDCHHRAQVEVDDFERSACAVPVMRGNLIAGVLVVSSAQPAFFHDPMACKAVAEYALMMGVALGDQDFIPFHSCG